MHQGGGGGQVHVESTLSALLVKRRTASESFARAHPAVVEHHRASIATKFGLQGSHSLVKFAVKHEPELG